MPELKPKLLDYTEELFILLADLSNSEKVFNFRLKNVTHAEHPWTRSFCLSESCPGPGKSAAKAAGGSSTAVMLCARCAAVRASCVSALCY